jgi:hypothetical protein
MGNHKLDVVVEAIEEARELTHTGSLVTVYVSKHNGLTRFNARELKHILTTLLQEEHIFGSLRDNWLLDMDSPDPGFMLSEGDYFEVELLDTFDQWRADYWQERSRKAEKAPNLSASAGRPAWVKTTADWDTKKAVWACWARGDTIKQTHVFLECNTDKYPALDRKTIGKVRSELTALPDAMVKKLVAELPEVSSLVERLRTGRQSA